MEWARGWPSRRRAPAKGNKKAGGPVWPTARSFVLAALPPGANCQVGADIPRTVALPPIGAVATCVLVTLRIAHLVKGLPVWQSADVRSARPILSTVVAESGLSLTHTDASFRRIVQSAPGLAATDQAG